jgi:hypothetical protein
MAVELDVDGVEFLDIGFIADLPAQVDVHDDGQERRHHTRQVTGV